VWRPLASSRFPQQREERVKRRGGECGELWMGEVSGEG
jgi:hypothetical protein